MNCAVCSFIKSDKVKKIFEDEEVVAFLNPTPAVPGEVLITTKKHYTVLGQVPNFVVGELFSLANKVSIALFELLGLQGTNILLNDGTAAGQQVPHVLIHVIPRKKGDNLNFDWERKKVSEDELKTALLNQMIGKMKAMQKRRRLKKNLNLLNLKRKTLRKKKTRTEVTKR